MKDILHHKKTHFDHYFEEEIANMKVYGNFNLIVIAYELWLLVF